MEMPVVREDFMFTLIATDDESYESGTYANIPLEIFIEGIYKHAMEEDLSQKKHALSRRQGVLLYAMKDDEAELGDMVNAAHDLCWFDMACMIGKERPQGSTRSGETWLPALQ